MSLLANQVFANPDLPLFVRNPLPSTITAQNIIANNITANNGTIGTLNNLATTTSSLTVGSGTANILFVSSLTADNFVCNASSIMEYLEVSSIAGEVVSVSSIFGISGEVSTLSTEKIILDQIVMLANPIPGPAYELTLNGQPVVTTSTLVSSITDWSKYPATNSTVNMDNNSIVNCSQLNMADSTTPGVFGTISSVGAITGSNTGLIRGFLNVVAGAVQTSTGTISSLTTSVLNTPAVNSNTVTANLVTSYPSSTLSISSYFALNEQAGTAINLLADQGINIAGNSEVNITAQNGNRGKITLTANGGFNNGVYGEVDIIANPGTIGSVGTGGLINITANSPLVVSSLTSAVKINAAGVNIYSGAIPPVGSLAGYSFIHSDVGTNITTGLPPVLPNVPLTTYLYGTNGVTTSSEFYAPSIYPYWNGITTPPDLMISGRYIIPNLATVYLQLSTVKSIEMAGAASISDVRTITGDNTVMTNISTINGVSYPPPIVSTFQTASISSLSLSSINNMAQFGTKSMIINGDVAQIQLANNAGQFTKLNLLSRQNYSEIQSFNSTFTAPLDLYFTADNFGFNTKNIVGGYEMDISGNTIVENGRLAVGSGAVSTIIENTGITTSQINVSSITGLTELNGKSYPTFGEFLTTSTITVGGANTPTVIPFDSNTVGNQVQLNAGAIEVLQAGLYEFKWSIQFDKSGGGTDTTDFWVRINGNDVANSASQVTITGTQAETLGTVFTYLNCNANDLIELVFASTDATMEAVTFPAWTAPPDPYTRPQIPAVIANIALIR